MSKFHVGALVVLKTDVSYDPGLEKYKGVITHIVGPSMSLKYDWELNLPGSGGYNIVAKEDALILVRDDGHTKTTWAECPWQPNELKAML